MTKNDLSSYKNFILLGFVLSTVYALCFFIMRLCLSLYSLDEFSLLKILDANFLPMFVMGLRLDLRAICVVFAFLLLLSLLASLNKSVFMARLKMTTGGAFEKENFSQNLKPNKKSSFCLKIDKFIHKFTLFFVGLTSFLIALSAFVNFYYFKTYHTKIDIFIFGLKDDDTEAILKIMWQDYPVTVILLASFIFAYLCFRLGKKILNANFFAQIELNLNKIYENSSKNSRLMKTSTIATVVLANLMLFVLVFIGARGSVGTFPLREDEHHISTNVLINHIATNPIIAFAWACQHYKAQEGFAPINETQLQALQEELFPIFRTNAPKQIHAKPNVVVVLMESFGTNLLLLDDEEDFDLLMSFRPHFEAGKIKQKGQKDFTFVNFLSAQNGTAPSFASLFFLSPSANLSLSSVKNKLLPLTPFEPYEKAGYELVFITSGNRAWQNLGDYMNTLGVNDVYDSNFLTRHYPQSKDFQSVYGVGDEFAYKFALELLSKATKPLFIVILTTSNHPPYSLPLNFKAPSYKLESKKAFFSQESREKIHKSLSAFSYASNAFGEFIK
ncbi:LTA synthase family protein, partial [Campylobacter troglodytis]|uniref:LTA synthase family protein n=1 Tax=Campylobacter troglodytis TaxID=654363 RepID=UPI00163B9CC6